MRDTLLTVIIVLQVMGFLTVVWAAMQMRSFVLEVPVINSFQSMERLKHFVAMQMYATLWYICCLTVPLVVYLYGKSTDVFTGLDILYVFVPAIVVLALTVPVRFLEKRVKSLPVDAEYREEFDKVIDTWVRKPLPTW